MTRRNRHNLSPYQRAQEELEQVERAIEENQARHDQLKLRQAGILRTMESIRQQRLDLLNQGAEG